MQAVGAQAHEAYKRRQDRHALTLRSLVCCMPAGMRAPPSRTAQKATQQYSCSSEFQTLLLLLSATSEAVRHVRTCPPPTHHPPLRGPPCSPAGTFAALARHRGSAWRGAGPAGHGQGTHTQRLSAAPARAEGGEGDVGGGVLAACGQLTCCSMAVPGVTTTCSSGNLGCWGVPGHLPSASSPPYCH